MGTNTLLKISNYAKAAGLTYNGVMNQVITGKLEMTLIDGIRFIDAAKYPPKKRGNEYTK